MSTSIEVRKKPVQARSKARVEQILKVAETLISEHGSDGLKMSEIAKRAEVPIGTVYQFFPNKSAVILTLAKSTMAQVRAGLDAELEGVASLAEAADRVEVALRGYHAFLKSNPTARDILCSTQGDKKLQQLDLEDSRKNARMLFGHLKRFVPESRHKWLADMCFLNMHLTGSLVCMTVELEEDEAEALLTQFVLSVRGQLEQLVEAGSL